MYEDYNNGVFGNGTSNEDAGGTAGENVSKDPGGSYESASSGGSFSDNSYSYNKSDLYEADYVVNDTASGQSYSGNFYKDPAGSHEEPRWEPNPGKYNTYNDYSGSGKPPKKKKKKWWIIPLVVILVLMVAFICVGVWYGFKYVDQYAESVETEEDTEDTTDDSTQISIADSSAASSSGIVLTDVTSVVEEVMPAVVSITSRSLVSNSNNYWGYYFGDSSSSSEEVESGIGSGTIVGQNDTELLILTSYHVVEDSSSLYVTFCDDSAVDGYIKSSSEDYDIAVVAVPLEDISESTLSSITIATLCTEQATVGEGVIVIGDALGYGQSVTTGIVSAVDREITVEERTITVIQTDAAINSGNSGGCVLNSAGQIIGISEAKISSDNVEGMCYAISISVYADLIQELLTTTTDTGSGTDETTSSQNIVSSSQTAYLGIKGTDVDSETASAYNMVEGIYVASVVSGGGAEAAGMIAGDIIVGFEGDAITTMSELQSLLANQSVGDTVTITVMRSNGSTGYTEIDLEVTLTAQIQ